MEITLYEIAQNNPELAQLLGNFISLFLVAIFDFLEGVFFCTFVRRKKIGLGSLIRYS